MRKTPGPDKINNKIWRTFMDELEKTLSKVFNRIIETERCPIQWWEVAEIRLSADVYNISIRSCNPHGAHHALQEILSTITPWTTPKKAFSSPHSKCIQGITSLL